LMLQSVYFKLKDDSSGPRVSSIIKKQNKAFWLMGMAGVDRVEWFCAFVK
jgi:hypothetical protein